MSCQSGWFEVKLGGSVKEREEQEESQECVLNQIWQKKWGFSCGAQVDLWSPHTLSQTHDWITSSLPPSLPPHRPPSPACSVSLVYFTSIPPSTLQLYIRLPASPCSVSNALTHTQHHIPGWRLWWQGLENNIVIHNTPYILVLSWEELHKCWDWSTANQSDQTPPQRCKDDYWSKTWTQIYRNDMTLLWCSRHNQEKTTYHDVTISDTLRQ